MTNDEHLDALRARLSRWADEISRESNPPVPPPPVDPPRRGGDDGGMEGRIAKLETKVEHLTDSMREVKEDVRALRADVTGIRTTDFRITFGAIIFVALGLAGLMAKGFGWLN